MRIALGKADAGDASAALGLFHLWNMYAMSWVVEYTDEFGAWWEDLTDAEQEDISAVAQI
jgi:hypothetical protein